MNFKLHNDPTKDLILKAGAGVVLVWVTRKVIKYLRKQGAESQVDNRPEFGQAQTLRIAMNPSGFDWLKRVDGTNNDVIFQVANEITDLEKVKNAYSELYDKASLYDDLQKELSPEEYQKFLSLATKGKVGPKKYAQKRDDILPNYWVITTSDANVRTKPVKESKYNPFNHIFRTVSRGKILGVTTGKFVYDESGDVTFIEFWTFDSKGKKNFFYVAKSQVELISHKDKLAREKKGKIPFELLERLGSTDNYAEPTQEVISTENADIYNEDFKWVGVAQQGMIIGFPIMTLDTGKHTLIKVETIQGLKRWVNIRQAVIKPRNI